MIVMGSVFLLFRLCHNATPGSLQSLCYRATSMPILHDRAIIELRRSPGFRWRHRLCQQIGKGQCYRVDHGSDASKSMAWPSMFKCSIIVVLVVLALIVVYNVSLACLRHITLPFTRAYHALGTCAIPPMGLIRAFVRAH